jgi:hypothetical protein
MATERALGDESAISSPPLTERAAAALDDRLNQEAPGVVACVGVRVASVAKADQGELRW